MAIPECVGIIMDGNRRFAKNKGEPTHEGHLAGYQKLKELVGWANEVGVGTLICYAFSTENWKRTEEEVGYLIDLLMKALREDIGGIIEKGIRVRFIGSRERFSPTLQKEMERVEKASEGNKEGDLVIALSYGGRAEIVSAVNALLEVGGKNISEEKFSQTLWTKDIPDPDIIIRTGGEKRLSNFLPWQSVYSELFFTDTLWPDFSKEEFLDILQTYEKRERRRGV